ncbi:MAG: hydrogenase nickel incorporation protein HypB [Candidatus Omnitrophica bacterium]|nr:hydrogenase nickel incorporation protein HypB [Candidatus Omnitrophota bacterium]
MTFKKVKIEQNLFSQNEEIARENKSIFTKHKILSLNFMGAPGCGKTSIIEKLIPELLAKKISCGVIEGDIAGSFDSERLEHYGIPLVQINTGGACHLDALMIKKGMENLPLKQLNVVIIENVGNLVCPAEFELGVDCNITVASITEGEEKPLKYPLMYSVSELVLLNKIDLINVVDFSIEKFTRFLKQINPKAELIAVSGRTGINIKAIKEYVLKKMGLL